MRLFMKRKLSGVSIRKLAQKDCWVNSAERQIQASG